MTARKSTKLSATAQAARDACTSDKERRNFDEMYRGMGEEMFKPGITTAERDVLGDMFSWFNDKATGTSHVEFSIARTMAALIGGLTAGGTLAYFGLQIIEVIAIATFAYTGFTFLAFMVGFVGMALTFIGAFVITGKVQEYILSGGIDRTYESSKALATEKIAVMKGWFKTRGEKVVDHAASSAASVYATLDGCKAKTVRSCDHA